MARFPLPSGASQGGGQGQARGIFILFWSDGRSVGRSAALSPLEIISVRHTHFPTLAMWPGKIPPMTDAANEATRLACARPTIPSSFARQCLSVHRDLLQTAGGGGVRVRRSPHCPSGIFGLLELHYYSFWHQILLLRQQTDAQIDSQRPSAAARAGLALGSHVGGNNRCDRVVLRSPPSALRQCADDTR